MSDSLDRTDPRAVSHIIRRDLEQLPWEHARERDGVRVLCALEPHSGYEAFRTVVEAPAPLEVVAAFLGPGLVSAMRVMNHLFLDGHVLRAATADSPQVVRTRFRLPRPFAPREFVHTLTMESFGPDEHVIGYLSASGDDLPPVTGGAVRCQVFPSGQRLTRLAGGRTRVEHYMVYALGGGVPRWVQNSVFHAGHVDAYLAEWRALGAVDGPLAVARAA